MPQESHVHADQSSTRAPASRSATRSPRPTPPPSTRSARQAAVGGAGVGGHPDADRAAAIEAIAAALDDAVDALVEIADRETALGEVRLRGEVARTSGQLRMFADLVRDGNYTDPIISPAAPAHRPSRCAPDARADRPGRRVRRQQLPVRVLGRRRRHRLGARGRLPGRRQGARGAPGDLAAGGRHRHRGARRGRRTGGRVRDRLRPRGRTHACAASGDQGGRLHRLDRGWTGPVRPGQRPVPIRSRSTANSAA